MVQTPEDHRIELGGDEIDKLLRRGTTPFLHRDYVNPAHSPGASSGVTRTTFVEVPESTGNSCMDAAVRAYQSSSQQAGRDQLITDHLKDVRHILGRLLVTLPENVDKENLEAAGVLGLVEAAHHFDPTRNVEFGAFAYHRIRGAILDELRRNCPLPQHMLEKWSRIRQAIDQLEGPVSMDLIAVRSGLSEQEVEKCFDAIRLTRPEVWQEEIGLAGTAETSPLEHQDKTTQLAGAIEQLDDRLRAIVGMYYRDELRLKEIGEVMGLSESRVSRLLQQAHVQLKMILRNDLDT